jgi:hypothetical protein
LLRREFTTAWLLGRLPNSHLATANP